MAESITIKALQDASLDAKSLEEVVNGNESKQVTTRLGETYPSVKKAIKTLFENGGLPATPFKTYALMTASALADGKYAQVTDDTVNNGLYVKTAGAWVKSAYDPLAQAKSYTDNQATGSKAFDLIYGNTTSDGYGLQSSTSITTSLAFTKTYAGESLVIKGSPTSLISVAIFTYDNNKQFISKSPNYGQQVTDREFPLPDGYIKLNVLPMTAPAPNSPEWLETIRTIVGLKYNKLRREYVEVAEQNNSVTANIPLEIGRIEKVTDGYTFTKIGDINSGRLVTADTVFLNERRSRKHLEVLGGTPIRVKYGNGNATIFEYDKDFQYLNQKSVTDGQDHRLSAITKYVKVSFYDITVPYPTASITFESKSNAPKWVFNVATPNRPYQNTNFTYEVDTNTGREIYLDVNDEQYTNTRYLNTGVLRLPSNYDPHGEPVRLIIFVQGSGGYLNINSSSINDGYESADTSKGVFNYWINEGYAVLGVYPWTTKYAGGSVNQGTPTGMACYSQGYQWVINNYNIARDGVFVSGKSSGGFCGTLLSYYFGIPILATALLAPVITPMRQPFGARYLERLAYVNDFGFTGDHTVLAEQESSPAVQRTEALFSYMRDNIAKTVGYNPFWCGLVDADFTALIESAIDKTETDIVPNANQKRICPVPIKIWAAEDDDVDTYGQSVVYVNSIRNTGGNAEMRTMPNGMGGHNSVDNSPIAPRLATHTTKLGIVHKDIALAMVEVVQYFRRFG